MRTITLRSCSDICSCTPKQWIGLCNTLLLVLAGILCAIVLYETYHLNQRCISVLDSSMDMSTVDIIEYEAIPHWRAVTNCITVYSAFYNPRGDKHLVIIGRNSRKEAPIMDDLKCLVKYQNEEIKLVNVSYSSVSAHNALYIYCITIEDSLPEKVAIVSLLDTAPNQWLKVEICFLDDNLNSNHRSVAACVKPFASNLISAKSIAEFVAFYELIGVRRMFFYNRFASNEVVDFIKHLINNRHSISLLRWNVENQMTDNWPSVWSECIQDCLHRAVAEHSDVLILGIHDFLIPRKYMTLPDMLNKTLSNYSKLNLKSLKVTSIADDKIVSNYILRLPSVSAIRGAHIFKDGILSTKFLPEEDATVLFRDEISGRNIFEDDHFQKYIHLLEKSAVLKALP